MHSVPSSELWGIFYVSLSHFINLLFNFILLENFKIFGVLHYKFIKKKIKNMTPSLDTGCRVGVLQFRWYQSTQIRFGPANRVRLKKGCYRIGAHVCYHVGVLLGFHAFGNHISRVLLSLLIYSFNARNSSSSDGCRNFS